MGDMPRIGDKGDAKVRSGSVKYPCSSSAQEEETKDEGCASFIFLLNHKFSEGRMACSGCWRGMKMLEGARKTRNFGANPPPELPNPTA